jgi:hypothetical protein
VMPCMRRFVQRHRFDKVRAANTPGNGRFADSVPLVTGEAVGGVQLLAPGYGFRIRLVACLGLDDSRGQEQKEKTDKREATACSAGRPD